MSISLISLMEMIKPLKNNNGDVIIHKGGVYPVVLDQVFHKYTENKKLHNMDISNYNYIYLKITEEILNLYKSCIENKTDINIDLRNDHIGDESVYRVNNSYNNIILLENFSYYYEYYTLRFNEYTQSTIHIDDLRDYKNFSELLGMKASDGMSFFWIENYPITYYNGLLPLNKPDKIMVDIYDDNQASFIVKYTIIKPKVKYTCFMRNRKLN